MSTSRAEAPASKAVAESIGTSWISQTPGVCGGDARVRNTRITVWGLIEWRRLGLSDAHLLDQIEGLTQEDLAVAWDYAAAHAEEIERAIRENDEA
jgi:uncharacterized protein (DUF433 family)